MKIEKFAGTGPAFFPEEFFNGKSEGWGIAENLFGGLQHRYTVSTTGSWDERSGIIQLDETWRFDDAHVDVLHWQIKKLSGGKYSGTETLLDGEARGEVAGCAFHWRYTRNTPRAGGGFARLNFDDWFFRVDENVAIARGVAGRVGLPLGTVHVTYRKIS